MTHDELVRLAANWLRKKKRLPIVLQDVKCMMTSEQPDVIAWNNSGFSTLLEIKVFPSDLIRDAEKTFRKVPDRGMGHTRWFVFPKGFFAHHVNALAHCPGAWGIVEIDPRGRPTTLRMPTPFHTWNRRDEQCLLIQATRKATEGWGRRTFGDIAPPMVDGDPHPTASKLIRELRTENAKMRRELQRLRPLVSAKENLLTPEELPEGLTPIQRANVLAINPFARVCLVGDKALQYQGTVDGWIGPRRVRVRWDAGHISDVDCASLTVVIAASPRA